VVRAGTAAAPLRCRFRLAQSSGCAWCVYRRNHRPRLLVSATPNPTCDRFAGHGGTDRGPHYPVTASLCFLSGWARIVAALKANPKPAQVARAIGGLHHTTVWQIVRAEGIRLAHPRRRGTRTRTRKAWIRQTSRRQARRRFRTHGAANACGAAGLIAQERARVPCAGFRNSGTAAKIVPLPSSIFSAKKQQI
jgi:hypothetical protein